MTADDVQAFRDFVGAIVAGDSARAIRSLNASPQLATAHAGAGATRPTAGENFFAEIQHYIYEDDTALHMAAAAGQTDVLAALIARGADPSAKNRRGAAPLHYAVDGGPDMPGWNPAAQTKIIARLVEAGADPNAVDKSGVAPLHRAVRNRCAAAVRALIQHGADPRAANANGSTPLLLATLNTGKSGSGSAEAKAQQKEILQLLGEHGAA